jgi:hypothetical protein
LDFLFTEFWEVRLWGANLAINPGLLPAFDDRGEASVVVMYFLLARGEQIVFLGGEQP